MTGPSPLRRSIARALALTALTVAALAAGPAGAAFAVNTFTIGNGSANEGSNVVFTVFLDDNNTGGNLTVDVDTFSGSATEGSDYAGIHQTLTFPPDGGGTVPQQQNVSAFATCDGFGEGTETFTANINTPTGGAAIGAQANGTGTIFDGCTSPQPGPNVDLAISKTDNPDPVQTGQTLVYTVLVQNLSSNTAFNVVMNEFLPSNVQFVSVATSQGTCGGFPTVTCQLGSMAGNTFAFIEVRVIPQSAGTLANSATVSTSNGDFNGANNTAGTQTSVFAPGTPAPAPIADETEDLTPPKANLSGPRRCELPACDIDLTSNEDGHAIAVGDVIIGNVRHARRVWFFRRVRRNIEAGQEETLRMRLRPRARRAIRRALRNRRRVRAEVEIIISDNQDNERIRRRRLRIVG